MKNLIIDHFRRWWWVWALGSVFYVIITVSICRLDGNPNRGADAFPLGVFLGAMLLGFDLQRGHARALLAMCVKPVDVARAWWWSAVGIPAIVFAVLSAIAIGIAAVIQAKPIAVQPVLINWAWNLLLLGVTFFALTGLPAKGYGTGDWRQQTRGVIFGVLYGGSIGGWMFLKTLDLATPLGGGIFGVCILMTIAGYFRSKALVMERAGLRPSSPPAARNKAAASRCAEGRGGLAYLAQFIFIRMLWMGLLMFLAYIVIFGFMGLSSRENKIGGDFIQADLFPMFCFQFLWMTGLQIIAFAAQVRYLRSLPVAPAKLTAVLIFTPLAAMSVCYYTIMLLISAIFQTPPPGLEKIIQQGALVQITLALVLVPLFIWRSMDMLSYLLMMLLIAAGTLCGVLLHGKFPIPASLIAAPIILLAVFVTTQWLIERNSRTYRPRTNQFGGWGWGGGR